MCTLVTLICDVSCMRSFGKVATFGIRSRLRFAPAIAPSIHSMVTSKTGKRRHVPLMLYFSGLAGPKEWSDVLRIDDMKSMIQSCIQQLLTPISVKTTRSLQVETPQHDGNDHIDANNDDDSEDVVACVLYPAPSGAANAPGSLQEHSDCNGVHGEALRSTLQQLSNQGDNTHNGSNQNAHQQAVDAITEQLDHYLSVQQKRGVANQEDLLTVMLRCSEAYLAAIRRIQNYYITDVDTSYFIGDSNGNYSKHNGVLNAAMVKPTLLYASVVQELEHKIQDMQPTRTNDNNKYKHHQQPPSSSPSQEEQVQLLPVKQADERSSSPEYRAISDEYLAINKSCVSGDVVEDSLGVQAPAEHVDMTADGIDVDKHHLHRKEPQSNADERVDTPPDHITHNHNDHRGKRLQREGNKYVYK